MFCGGRLLYPGIFGLFVAGFTSIEDWTLFCQLKAIYNRNAIRPKCCYPRSFDRSGAVEVGCFLCVIFL